MSHHGPLHGVQVVSLAINLPGPLAVARLRVLGATVTKIEPPTGDPLQAVVPAWYAELTEGQQVMTLDLKDPGDRTAAARELANADLLLTAQRPSALVKLGLNELTAANPRLSHVEIVGHDGTAAEQPGHDLTYQAVHGTLQPPTMPTVPVADLLGAERAVSAALLALRVAADSGVGRHERVVLEHAAADAAAAVRHGLTGTGAPLGGAHPGYRIYSSADGYVALAALEPHFWARICDSLGVDGTHDELEQAFLSRPTHEWEELAERLDIPLIGIRDATPRNSLHRISTPGALQ